MNTTLALYIALQSIGAPPPIGYPRPPLSRPRISQPDANGGVSGSGQGCSNALNACLKLTEAQDVSIVSLKASNKELIDRLSDATKPLLLPTWALITISLLAGATVASLLHK